jgi:hypothetical protein
MEWIPRGLGTYGQGLILKEEEARGLVLIGSLLRNTKASLGPIHGGTLVKHGNYGEMHLPTSHSHSYGISQLKHLSTC